MPVAPLAIIDVDAPSEPDKNWPGWGESGRSSLQGTDLVSVDRVSMVFAMSEGPCGGMADLERSIELDGIPIRAADGTWNFEGITVAVTDGTADQYYIPGFDAIESEQSNGTPEVKFGTASIFNVTTSHANSARVKVSVPSFQKMDTGTGKGGVTSARIQISVSVDGGAYVVQELDENGWIKGYSSGPYVRGYKIALPDGAVRSIKVERLDAINTDTLVANKTYLQGWTEITDVKLRHPYVSLLALSFDAKLFGSIPVVTADWKGLLLRVPANYTPPFETAPGVWTPAVYATSGAGTTGEIWDGTFKTVDQWCSSPAWAFWTIATNKRYGCGKYLSDLDIDADALYEISKYCDELVTDGTPTGKRPRFALNAYLTNDEESFKVLAHIISTARAQLYYSGGKMRPVQDVETDVVALFSPSNVKEGRFEYSGVAKRARHTMAKVSWWDASQSYKIVPEPIQHLEGIAKYGVQTLDTTAFGATNLAQARAWGNWALITEQTETEAVSFTSGLEGMAVTIGDIIHVKDPSRDVAGLGGRLIGATTTALTLDRPVILQSGITYTAWVTLNDGSVESRTVTTAAGTVSAVVVTPALTSAPQAENQWQIADSTASPSRWRILSIKRPNSHEFEISALANNPAKYALADAIGSLVPTVTVPVVFSPVSGLMVSSTSTYAQGSAVLTATAKWTQPLKATGALAQAQINGAWEPMAVVGASASIQIPNAGTVPVRVVALYPNGRSSVVSGSVSVTDVYSDGVISRGAEKVRTQADWVTAQADYVTLGDKATALGVSRTTFNAAYTALSGVAIRWTDATIDTVISDLSPTLPTRWATWSAQCVAMQTAIITATQEAAATDATTKANAAQSAAIAAAAADATAKRVMAEAYADGIVTDEENARIAAASTASTAANAYADLKRIEAEAYADGIVSDEEARAIADATAKAAAAQAAAIAAAALDASSKASAAQSAAIASAATTAMQKAAFTTDGVHIQGTTLAGGSITAAAMSNSDSTNLIPNGNSETAAPAGGWPAGSFEAIGITSGNPFQGSKCRWMPVGLYHLSPMIACASNDQHYMSTMIQSYNDGTSQGQIAIRYYDYAGNYLSAGVNVPIIYRPSWVQVSTTGIAPANASFVDFCVYTTTGGIYVDNLYAGRVIVAGMLAANSVVAGTAAIGSILAGNLVVANLDNLIPNPTSDQPAPAGGWPAGAWEAVALAPGGYEGNNGRWIPPATFYKITPLIPVKAGEQYYLEAMMQAASGTTGYLELRALDVNGADLGNVNGGAPGTTSTTWTKVSSSFTIDPGTAFIQVWLYSTTGITGYDNFYLRRMADANILVDGILDALLVKAAKFASSAYTPATDTINGGTYAAAGWCARDGAPMEVSALGLKIGKSLIGEPLARAMKALRSPDFTASDYFTYYAGSNNVSGTVTPDISKLTVTPTHWDTTNGDIAIDLAIQPTARGNNLDGMRRAKVVLYKQSARGTTGTLTQIGPSAGYKRSLHDQSYVSTTLSDAVNAIVETLDLHLGGLTGYPAALVTLYNVNGSSDTHCFYSGSTWTAGSALVDNGTSWPAGLSGGTAGNTGGGGTGGGNNKEIAILS